MGAHCTDACPRERHPHHRRAAATDRATAAGRHPTGAPPTISVELLVSRHDRPHPHRRRRIARHRIPRREQDLPRRHAGGGPPQPHRRRRRHDRAARAVGLGQDHPAAHGEPAGGPHLGVRAHRRRRRERHKSGAAASPHRLRDAGPRIAAAPPGDRQHRHGPPPAGTPPRRRPRRRTRPDGHGGTRSRPGHALSASALGASANASASPGRWPPIRACC